jgi:hypothetical protein
MSKNKNLERFMEDIEKISDAFNMSKDDFGQRAMRTSVLSTGYAGTKDALDYRRVSYRRTLNMKVGIAVADVFETSQQNELPMEEFMNRVIPAYMRLCGIPFIERENRRSEVKALIESYLERLIELGLISISNKNQQKYVTMMPELGSSAYAMIMNPESMLRSPYIKAISQTIGAMALVDKKQNSWTVKEISDLVQDSMIRKGIIKNWKPTYLFSAQNIEPFHVSHKVQFYSSLEEKLIILPTFPKPGTVTQLTKLDMPLINKELAFELFGLQGINDLTSGPNPPLIPIATGDSTIYFHRNDAYINAFKDHLGAPLSKFIPQQGIALRSLSEIQSKLGKDHYDGIRVASIIQKIIEGGIKEGSYQSNPVEREIVTVLYARLGFIQPNDQGIFQPIERMKPHLSYLRGLCDIKNPTARPIADITTEEE